MTTPVSRSEPHPPDHPSHSSPSRQTRATAMPPPALSLNTGSTPLPNQVAGHQNVMADASGSLVIKPALPREIAFYHLLNSASRSSQLAKMKPFVPQFFGTLRLEGKLDNRGSLTLKGVPVEEIPESVVLENLAHTYTKPSVLDVKLGTVLHAPDAPPEKKEKMDKQAKSTTTWETGIRLTGCQTWHAPSSSYILTPKSFGKSITVAQLPNGITRFFPLPTDIIPAIILPPINSPSSTATSPNTATGIPHIPVPSSTLPAPVNPAESTTPTTPSSGWIPIANAGPSANGIAINAGNKEYRSHAIPAKTMLRVLELVDIELGRLEEVLQHLEARFIGASILLVYEGDPERLESALDRWEIKRAKEALLAAEKAKLQAVHPGQTLSEESEESEEEFEDDDDSEGDDDSSSTSSDDDEDDGAAADARRARRCPPLTLRMIDFAHTRLVEGEGVDEGVLKGVRTLRGLIQGRTEEVREAVELERSVPVGAGEAATAPGGGDGA